MDKITKERIVEEIYFIYGLSSSKNPEEIRYIGYSKSPEVRLANHLRDCNRTKVKTYKKKWLSKELFSGNKIILTVIKEVNSQEMAKIEEIALIKLYKSFGARLVNGTKGGDGVVCTEEVRKKMSDGRRGKKQPLEAIERSRLANIGRKHSEETLNKMRESRKGICTRNPWTDEQRFIKSEFTKANPIPRDNNPMTEDIKRKISDSKKGIPSSKRKKVIQFTCDGNIVREFDSLLEAIRITKINNIHRCITGKRKTAGTFMWKFKD